MALINCPECGKEISDKAAACPNCGFPISEYVASQRNTEKETVFKKCPYCGSKEPSDSAYCDNCGMRLTQYVSPRNTSKQNNNVDNHQTAIKLGQSKFAAQYLRCPQCKSSNIQILGNNQKSFSIGKALGGTIIAGRIGTLVGFSGKKGEYEVFCMDCGRRWKTK